MQTKTLDIVIPDYLTVDQYRLMNNYKGDSDFGRMVHAVSSLSGQPFETVRKWPLSVLTEVANAFAEIADHKHEFHSIIEWNGKLYGYAPIRKSTLGEYIDIENLSKDLENNMHKIAAILYRPITVHRFKSFKFAVKQKIKMLSNKVENVFDWYDVEPYDNQKRKLVEEEFKDFPAHIFLGAVSFFLSTVNLYSISTLSSQRKISTRRADKMIKEQLQALSQTTGAGGGLFTHSVNPIYYKLQGTPPSQK